MNDDLAKATIRRHEGRRKIVYRDTRGIATVGNGFALQQMGAKGPEPSTAARIVCEKVGVDYDALLAGRVELTDPQIDAIFEYQYADVRSCARVTFPDIDTMPDEAQAVICDMIFNLGYGGFLLFQHFIQAMRQERWAVAIQHMEESLWAKQVPNRVADDVKLLEQIGAEPILKG